MANKKLWIVLGLALLLIVSACVLIFADFGGEAADPCADTDGKYYWNIDRLQYVGSDVNPMPSISSRHDRDDVYYLRMAVDGEQIEVMAKDVQLVQQMDNWDLMCLGFDEEGYVTKVVPATKWSQKVLEDVYVQSIDGQTVTVNSNAYYTALERRITVTEDTLVYNVANYDGSGLLTGFAGTLNLDDEITVVLDKNGCATHIYTAPYRTPGKLYYSTERLYDSSSKMTTRLSDTLGYYNYEFMVDGELVKLRTRDLAVASKIDQQPYQWVGLEFDENGDIIAANSGGVTVYGKGACLNSSVQSIQWDDYGATIKCIYPSSDKTTQGRLHPDCKIYDYSGEGEFGQLTELREGDYIRALRDHRGRIIYIAVVYRPNVYTHVYLLDRQYDSKTKSTLRQPDGEGYYHIKASVNGQTMTLRCSDRKLVTYMDSQGTNIVGVLLRDDEIIRTAPATYTLAGYYLASGWDVTAFDAAAGTMEVTSMSGDTKGNTKTGTLASNCKVYNVSLLADTVGQTDQVQVGDTVRAYTNHKGEVEVIYVTKRPMHSPAYRKLKELGKQADGYYHYLMAVNGKQIIVKANGEARTQIEKSKTLGLYLTSNNVAYKSVSAVHIAGFNGGVFATDYTVTGYGSTLTLVKGKDTLSAPMANNCQIYNLTAYGNYTGEATTLRIGDKVQCFKDKAGNITLIYVTERTAHTVSNHCACYGSEYHTDHSGCEKLKWTKLPEAVDNQIIITQSGNYYLSHNAAGMLIVEPGLTVNLCLNGYLLRARQALTAREGAVVNISDCGTKGCISGTHDENGGYAVKVSGGTVNLYSGILNGVQPFNTAQKNRCVLLESGSFNMYGGTIRDGYLIDSKNGGNVLVQSGSFTMLGGTITGGQVTNGKGADVYVSNGATMTLGGKAQSGNVYLADGAVFNFHESLNESKASACVDMATAGTRFGVGSAKEAYTQVITTGDPTYTVRYDEALQALYLRSNIAHAHCVCVGSDHIVDHAACTQIDWEPLPAVVDNKITIQYSGHYYMTKNAAASLEIQEGLEVSVCLNGYFLYGRQPITVGQNVTLNICDHVGTGAVYSNKDDNGGYAIKVNGGIVNFYSGVLSGKNYTSGILNRSVLLTSGQFNMYGGKICDGSLIDSKNGGNVLIQSGTFTMLGGTITGGQVTNGKGSDLYVSAGAALVLGGDAKAGNVYIATGADMDFHESFTTASACVELEDMTMHLGVGNAKENYAQTIISQNEDYEVAYDVQQMSLYLKSLGHRHCICVGSDHVQEHAACEHVLWVEVPAKASNKITITESGHYFLTQSQAATLVISEGLTVELCLNGFDLYGSTPITVGENVTLSICDHTGNGRVYSSKNDSTGYAVKVDGGIFNFYSGTLRGLNKDNQRPNRPVQITAGQFNMYGGAICDGTSKSGENGGNILINGGNFTMYGGIISGGSTTKHGGNICIQNGTFTMKDGTIAGGVAGNKGGNVMLLADAKNKTAQFILENGTVSGGLTEEGAVNAQNGGNICVNATTGISKFTMYGGSVIGGQVSQKGANVFVYKSEGSVIELATGIELADVYLDTGKEITEIEPK